MVSIGTPGGNSYCNQVSRSLWYIFWCWWIYTDRYRQCTEIRGDGRFLTGVSAGKFVTETAGIVTNTSVGINTSTVDDNDLTGIGNSFQGLYVSNGMVIHDNRLNGVHYIGTATMVSWRAVTIGGTLTIDGNYVVV